MRAATNETLMRSRATHIWDADPTGHYVEPLWTSARLFEVECFGARGALVLDPCAGWGRIPHNAMAANYTALGIDVVDRQHERFAHDGFRFIRGDFLRDPIPLPPIVSAIFNPPFGDIQQFVERALDVATLKVATLVPLRRLPAMHWIASKPLETIWILTPRPSLPPASYIRAGHVPHSGGQDFCWLVFNRQTLADAPRTKWLHRDCAPSPIPAHAAPTGAQPGFINPTTLIGYPP
jgi:hypothetical protein